MRLLAALALVAALQGCAILKAVGCTSAYFIGPAGYPAAVACAIHDTVEEQPEELHV